MSIYLLLNLKVRLVQLKNQQISWLFNALIFENFEFLNWYNTMCVLKFQI